MSGRVELEVGGGKNTLTAELCECLFKVFQVSPSPLALVELGSWKIIEVSDSFLFLLGYKKEEVLGKTSEEINFYAEQADKVAVRRAALEKGSFRDILVIFLTKSGSQRVGLMSGEKLNYSGRPCVLLALNDVTEKREMERELARLNRLGLVGEMAAGVGHEIRNPLTTIRGFLQVLKSRPEVAALGRNFDLVIDELDRVNAIITEFLNLARNKPSGLKPYNLNDIILALYPLLAADALVADKYIELDLGCEVAEIFLDQREIKQLLTNLVRNGLEAMLPGGVLTIRTGCTGKEVVMSVADQGSGIDPQIMDKIGKPFFTTKKSGNGLGLPVCYSIAARHGAQIKIDTGPCGTTFHVCFPVW